MKEPQAMADPQIIPQTDGADAPEAAPISIVPVGAENQLPQFIEVLDFATQHYGADSETALYIKVRIEEIELEHRNLAAQLAGAKAIPKSIALNAEKGAVLFIMMGVVLLLALVGTSTMFLGMLALKLFNT